MSYRRRRGMGSWSWWPFGSSGAEDEGERTADPGREARPGGEPPGDGGRRGPSVSRSSSSDAGDRWRRRAGIVAALGLLIGAGYLLSAQWLFPGSAEDAVAGEVVEVPELVGLTVEEARSALEASELTYRQRSEMPHPRAPEGAVVAQSPLPGQLARPGAPVSVTVSLGPERRVVPDLRGLSDRQARIVLERLGFQPAVDSTSSEMERGRVVGTRPRAGTEREVPAEVELIVSRGPRTARVPELVGTHVDDVEDRLQQAGLEMGEVTYDSEAFAAPGRVIGQSPAPGYALRVGGRVSVRVAGEAPEPRPGRELPPAGPDTVDTVPDDDTTSEVEVFRPGRER